MRVVHVTHQFAPETHGGLETYVGDMARVQIDAGHDVTVVSGSMAPRPQVELDPTEDIAGVPVRRLHRSDLYFDDWNKIDCPEVGRRLHDILTELAPDIVHVHQWIRLTQDIVDIARAMGAAVVVTLHDFATSCPRCFRIDRDGESCAKPMSATNCRSCVPRRPWQNLEDVDSELELFRDSFRGELTRAHRVVCASRAVIDLVARSLDLAVDAFTVLPLGYRCRFVAPEVTEPTAAELFRLAYWGSITERKGVEQLIGAFGRAWRGGRFGPDRQVRLDIFGSADTPARQASLESLAEGLPVGLHGRFEYSELEQARLHAAVFPSLCLETYGIVLDEAFELGLPVVVSDAGALTERAGNAGLRFPIGDDDALADRLVEITNLATWQRLRAAVPNDLFDVARHADALAVIYAEAREAARAAGTHDATVASHAKRLAQRRREQAFRRAEAQFRRLIERDGPDVV